MLALTAPALWAQDGLEGALSRANLAMPFGRSLAVADFDNDAKHDGAVLQDSLRRRGLRSFELEVHLSSRDNVRFSFQSKENALSIRARDIDGDNDLDIVVEQSFTEERLHVWMNDGQGRFKKGRIADFSSPAAPVRERLTLLGHRSDFPALALPTSAVMNSQTCQLAI